MLAVKVSYVVLNQLIDFAFLELFTLQALHWVHILFRQKALWFIIYFLQQKLTKTTFQNNRNTFCAQYVGLFEV